jgi:hypothetical protein
LLFRELNYGKNSPVRNLSRATCRRGGSVAKLPRVTVNLLNAVLSLAEAW